jgi:membrane protein implicated in regulation of membrane protease activity
MSTFINQLRESTQLLVYVVTLGAGLVYLLASFALSQFGGDHGDHGEEIDSDHADSGHHTVSIFSPKIIALFCVGLGVGGSLSTIYGCGITVSALVGLASGMSLGGLMLIGLRALYSQQASSNIDVASAVGRSAEVVTDIPAGGTGEVSLSVSGQYTTFFARASNHEVKISRGRIVKVSSVSGSTLIVE